MSLANHQVEPAEINWSDIEANERHAARQQFRSAFLFMCPAIAFVVVLLLIPVMLNVYFSMTEWKRFSGLDSFAGLANFERLFTVDIFFPTALRNTVIWVISSLILPLSVGFGLAAIVSNIRSAGVVKNIIFLPRVLAPTVVGTIWFYVYAPDGIVNRILGFFLGQEIDIGFLYQENTVTPSIIATFVWQTAGLVMVLILLGLSAIPKDPVEAARVDGASRVQVFGYIVLPLLSPTLLMIAILSVLAGFTAFDLLFVMAEAFSGKKSISLAVQMYFESFQKGAWATGSALAVIIGATVFCMTWMQMWLQARIENLIR